MKKIIIIITLILTSNAYSSSQYVGEDGSGKYFNICYQTGEDGSGKTGEDGSGKTGEDGSGKTGEDGSGKTGEDGSGFNEYCEIVNVEFTNFNL